MMAAGTITVTLNEQFLPRALMTVVELGRGGSPRGEAGESAASHLWILPPLQRPTTSKQNPS